MYVQDKQTGEKFEAEIRRVTDRELARLKKSTRYEFDWTIYKGQEVYKLCLMGEKNSLGLMRVIDRPEQGFDFLEVDVIEISNENKGKENGLGRIGGCLLAYAALLSDQYGHDGFVFLVAKNKKAPLFHFKFGFQNIGGIAVRGVRMSSNTANSIELIKTYLEKKITDDDK
jgi:hypothetical protein